MTVPQPCDDEASACGDDCFGGFWDFGEFYRHHRIWRIIWHVVILLAVASFLLAFLRYLLARFILRLLFTEGGRGGGNIGFLSSTDSAQIQVL